MPLVANIYIIYFPNKIYNLHLNYLYKMKSKLFIILLGTIQVLRNAVGRGAVRFPRKKHYEGVQFLVLSS